MLAELLLPCVAAALDAAPRHPPQSAPRPLHGPRVRSDETRRAPPSPRCALYPPWTGGSCELCPHTLAAAGGGGGGGGGGRSQVLRRTCTVRLCCGRTDSAVPSAMLQRLLAADAPAVSPAERRFGTAELRECNATASPPWRLELPR